MKILRKNDFFKKNRSLKIEREDNIITIDNQSDFEQTVIVKRIFKTNNECFEIKFNGDVLQGDKRGAVVKLVSKSRKVFLEIPFNTSMYIPKKANFFMAALRIMPNTKIAIKELEVNFIEKYDDKVKEGLVGDTVIIVPGYPSQQHRYNFGFVHSKVRKYKENGWNVDILSVNGEERSEKYAFEGINVTKTNYLLARDILQENKYKRIIIHFFNDEYANMIDAVDISDSEVYIYAHGADLLYRDYNIMTTQYFKQPLPITNSQKELYSRKDDILMKYNERENVRFIFGTEWAKNRAEQQDGIEFKNVNIIPCIVDEEIFTYSEKTAEDRRKIFSIKKFDNINTYSVDILVRTILELSKRAFFKELEFNIYGDGTEFDRLLEPLKKFENVKLNKGYLTHEEIANIHKENGIGLFPTRYETQGVSASEAAMSGLVVLTSEVAAVPEVFTDKRFLCDKEDYIGFANKIEYLYNNPDKFIEQSKDIHDMIYNRFGTEVVMSKEFDMYDKFKGAHETIEIKEQENEIILSIAVASYNVEKYLKNGILSLLRSNVASKLEILIINDGSKDRTAEVAKLLEDMTTINGKSIVKLVDKENGGHGSAINKGIELANGKYFKLMDGDDFFNTEELEKLVRILEKTSCDIVLNNYVEDLAVYCTRNEMYLYDFMTPGTEYNLEDLCEGEYGFYKWGPLLSTSTYRTQMLKDANFKISEKCFYVDMELNTYAFINAKNIVYYPLNIYVYYLGRAGQSVSQKSYMKNYKHHEHVILKLIDEYTHNSSISDKKKLYIKNKIIFPMIECQYMIATVFFSNSTAFKSFDSKLKEFGEFYNHMSGRRIKINRLTGGKTIRLFKIIDSIKRRLKR